MAKKNQDLRAQRYEDFVLQNSADYKKSAHFPKQGMSTSQRIH
ncbi:hypothetical protein [Flavobacterium lindanitolerans]|nr:hypothetical protein [Flavobacterium lindanitolerans]